MYIQGNPGITNRTSVNTAIPRRTVSLQGCVIHEWKAVNIFDPDQLFFRNFTRRLPARNISWRWQTTSRQLRPNFQFQVSAVEFRRDRAAQRFESAAGRRRRERTDCVLRRQRPTVRARGRGMKSRRARTKENRPVRRRALRRWGDQGFDGKGVWWDGLDPQDLYAQNHQPGKGLNWDWDPANGSSDARRGLH